MADQKRILHVFSSLELGGTQRRFLDYIKGSEADFSHTVYAMDNNYTALDGIDSVDRLMGGENLVPKGDTWQAIKATRKILKEHRPDLLVTYNWGATEWVLANSVFSICPTIHIQDGFAEDEQDNEILKRRMLRALAYRTCHKIVVPSKTLEALALNSWKIPKKKLLFLPNGVELQRFTGDADVKLLAEHNLTDTPTIIGTVAGLRSEKNIGRLIEAFSTVEDSHPKAKLVIVGDGVGMSALKMLAERVCSKGQVVFTGALANPEKILPTFDIFALSSDTEQMPLSVIEAMVCGLPIASTDVGDVRAMVSEENQPYIAGKDAAILAENIGDLLSDNDTARTIGAANKEKALSTYSLDDMIKAYDTLFNEAL